MHSFTTDESPHYQSWPVRGTLVLHTGEYGWGYETHTSIPDKLAYLATYVASLAICWDERLRCSVVEPESFVKVESNDGNEFELFEYVGTVENVIAFIDMLKEHTGADRVLWDIDVGCYIDHQSTDVAADALACAKDFVFKNVTLVIDNDNH